LAVLESSEHNIDQREKEINQIAKSIHQLAEIFRDLQTLVLDQGTVLDRIDYNIEQTNIQVKEAVVQLDKVHYSHILFAYYLISIRELNIKVKPENVS
jgi:syntaxin 16